MGCMNSWHLQVEVYDNDVEYQDIMGEYECGDKIPWPHGDGTKEDWERYWKNKYSNTLNNIELFEPRKSIALPAPMEHQPTWDMIHVEHFIDKRIKSLEEISKMESPVLHKWHTWYVADHDDAPSGDPDANYSLDKFLGYKLYQPKISSWNKIWESDRNLYNYRLLQGRTGQKGLPPKGWHDEYLDEDEPWYAGLPGYGTSQGVYLNDGVYGHGGPELIWKSTTDEEMWEPDEYR